MKKDWTNQDVARVQYLIDKHGKSQGIKLFSIESGRTINSIRIKLSRLDKEKIVMNAENQAYKMLEKEQNKTYTHEEVRKKPNWLSIIFNFFHKAS